MIDFEKEQLIGDMAAKYFKSGYYCSEAIVRAFEDVTGVIFSDDFKKAMTILGDGICGSGCLCGAVSSAIMIIGFFTGRLSAKESDKASQKLGNYFMSEFKKQYGTTCCRALRKKGEIVLGIGKYKHCPEITAFSARLLYKILSEKGYIQ